MKFGVKLSSSSLIIYLKIENYSLVLNKYDDNWVTVNLRIQGSGLDVNYRLNSLLSEEIDELLDDNRNFIAFNIGDNELEHFYIYLQLVTGKRTVDDVVVQNYIDSGIFQEWT